MPFHQKTSSAQNPNLYPAASVSFSEPWQHFLHLSTHSFSITEQSLKSPCNAPGLTTKFCCWILSHFACTHLTILWEWKGCRLAWLLTPIVGTSNSSDTSGRLQWIEASPIHDPVSNCESRSSIYIYGHFKFRVWRWDVKVTRNQGELFRSL